MAYMMQLGPFQFELGRVAPTNWSEKHSYNWATKERAGINPVQAAVAVGLKTMSLRGTVYTTYEAAPLTNITGMVGAARFEPLKIAAEKMEPLFLITGRGKILGKWVVTDIEIDHSVPTDDGLALKQDFTVNIRSYDESVNLSRVITNANNNRVVDKR